MTIASVVRRVARLLRETGKKVVFAESCTGGLVSGALTAIPGISNFHCGGMVVYRSATKTAYLGVPQRVIERFDAVSAEVAIEMARRVLAKTPEANVAVSVTGHLGPDAPAALDGLVFVGIAARLRAKHISSKEKIIKLRCRANDSRIVRQRWVVEQVLDALSQELHDAGQKQS